MNGSIRQWLIALVLFVPLVLEAQDQRPILQRRITLQSENIRLQTALALMAKEGGFKLSYNAAAVPADSLVSLNCANEKVDIALRRVLPSGLQWKESGVHLIITGNSTRKQRFTASGSVFDAVDGSPLASASVVELKRSNATVTASNGSFELALAGDLESTPLLFSRQGYRDTVVFVPRNAEIGQVKLKPMEKLERIEPICLQDRCGVEDLGLARLLVPNSQMQQAANLDYTEKSDWQVSLIPSLSTNGPISGSVTNRISFNVIGGYARGLEGVELAGALNMLSNDMHGLQIAGMSNLVGGHTRGVQIAGGVNHAMRSSEGLQLAGGGNVVWDTLSGVQVAGGVNIVKREMTGTQISGGANIALRDLNGVQVSGGVNITHGVVNKAQIAGGLNYARAVKGGQVAGGMNISLGDVSGGQVGLAANYAKSVSGGQVSLGLNVVQGEVSGGQVGLGMNYAGSATGGQFSFGANVVPGEVTAGQFTFGLNYAGSISGGQFAFGANIVPGTLEGGQVGIFNFARIAKGGQVGLVNLSDSLTGAAFGLLTISLKGYHRFDISRNDIMPLSFQLRTGTRGFHNIFGYSAPLAYADRWGFSYGLGSEVGLGKRLFLNIDVTAEQVIEQRERPQVVNVVFRGNLSLGALIADRFVFTAGPVLNTLITDWRDADTGEFLSGLPPSEPLFDEVNTVRTVGWLGWKVAVGVRF